jgi:uncharacterized membrane protein
MKKLIVGATIGSILGIFCIIGANLRFEGELSNTYLFSFWFNRLLMGLFLGMWPFKLNGIKGYLSAIGIGLFVSFAFYSATEYLDFTGFLAGGVYGLIIAFTINKMKRRLDCE